MSLAQWKANGWLKPHVTSEQELKNLLQIADRDIADAASEGLSERNCVQMSSDGWRRSIQDLFEIKGSAGSFNTESQRI